MLVLLGIAGCLVWRTSVVGLDRLAIIGKPGSEWWRLLTAPFIYNNIGYAFVTIGAIALFGWLLERRHGPVARRAPVPGRRRRRDRRDGGGLPASRSRSAATARRWRCSARGRSPICCRSAPARRSTGDLLGTVVIAVAVALMPLAVREASWLAGGVGAAVGFAIGLPLAQMQDRIRGLRDADRPGRAVVEPADQPARRSRPLGRRDGGEQAARGHRVDREPPPLLGDRVVEGREAPRRGRGCAASRRPPRPPPGRRAARARPRSRAPRGRRPRPRGRWPSASSCRWPSRPKPVTSVRAWAPAARGAASGVAVERRHHRRRARSEGRRAGRA